MILHADGCGRGKMRANGLCQTVEEGAEGQRGGDGILCSSAPLLPCSSARYPRGRRAPTFGVGRLRAGEVRRGMDRRVLQGWWFERQGLMDPQAGSSSGEALAQTGWARSVGGMNPYMALFARAGISREQVDRDLAAQAVHELPSARGCT